MTVAFTAATTIGHPADQVWDRLTDWSSAAQWMPGVDALRAEGPVAAGTTLVFTARGKERRGSIVAVEPGRSVTVRSIQGGVTADYAYGCVGHGHTTRVSLVADCSITGPWRLLGPLIRFAIRRADGGQLDAFAATFDRHSRPAPSRSAR
jgi:carbon monoxide dehydrogenase subunit G